MQKPKYHSLYPTPFKLDGGAMFGIIPKPLWEKKIKADNFNRIEMSCRIFYIQTENKHILIDLGVGDYHGEKFDGRFGLNSSPNPIKHILDSHKGLKPEDITDIVLTHLHFDHVGGLGYNGGLEELFPNATLHINKKHFEYSLNPTPRDQGSFHSHFFKPLIQKYDARNKVNWLDSSSNFILKDNAYELKFLISHGHTPDQILPYDQSMIYLGDLVPTTHHLPLAWSMGYDIQPGESSLERIKVYDFILKNNLIMVFDHDKDYWGARILKTEKGYCFEETYPITHNEFETHKIG